MDKVIESLTICFQEPFWIGIFECISNEKLKVCKVTFGAEPKDCEVYYYILRNHERLKFSPAIISDTKELPKNPKRLQREAKKQTQCIGIGTKSQQALQLQREQMKTEVKKLKREKREAEEKFKFNLKQQKRKQKHRGR